MLAELIDKRCHTFMFGECEFSLRYTLSALLELERKGLSFMDIFSESLTGRQIIDFFSAGLREKLPEEYLLKIAETIGFEALLRHCAEGVIRAFPDPEKNIVPKPASPEKTEFPFARLRALICDVLGKSEDFFWNSTPAELLSRWKEYAIAMGYAEEPEKILEFDTEGM